MATYASYFTGSNIIPLTEREQRERANERQAWRRFVLPEIRVSLQKQGELEETEERVDGKPKPFQVEYTSLLSQYTCLLSWQYKRLLSHVIMFTSKLVISYILFNV